jgi:hypothetical protein
MDYTTARNFIPNQYFYNTWYPGEFNGQQFEIAIRKGGFLWVKYRAFCKVGHIDGTTDRQPCWKYYRSNKKQQWVYVDFELINEAVA